MKVIAKLKNLHISSRKVKLVVDLIRDMNAVKALKILKYCPKKGSLPLEKLLLSVISNWQNKNKNLKIENFELYIESIFVNCAGMLKRIRPAPQGRAHRIRKRLSHITIILDSKIKINK
jgi:large subunit ribosomal protein L22